MDQKEFSRRGGIARAKKLSENRRKEIGLMGAEAKKNKNEIR